MDKYDIVVVGLGPAGATAGIYAARYNLKVVVIGKMPGGTAAEAHKICNYPPFKEIKGFEYAQKILEHLQGLKVPVVFGEVEEIKKESDGFVLKYQNKEIYAKNVIIATGTSKRKLNLDRENEFLGKGISYCATCDAAFYKNKVAAVVGGGNAALTAALLLSEFAKKVYIIYRKDHFFRAEPAWIKQVESKEKIVSLFSTEIEKLKGKDKLEKVKLNNGEELALDGLFVEIGSIPRSDLVKPLSVKINERKEIIVNEQQETNIKGLYAVGDVSNSNLKQIVVAEADGAKAATFAYKDLHS